VKNLKPVKTEKLLSCRTVGVAVSCNSCCGSIGLLAQPMAEEEDIDGTEQGMNILMRRGYRPGDKVA